MKRLRLILLGLVPLALGYLQNFLMQSLPSLPAPLLPCLAFLTLIVWFLLCYFFYLGPGKGGQTVLFLCAPGAAALALLFVQEIVLGAYWQNVIGLATQLFFLPLVTLGFAIIRPFALLFTGLNHGVFPTYCLCLALLILTAVLACHRARQQAS